MSKPSGYWTVAELAVRWRVSRMTVYRRIEAGELPALRVGRLYRVPAYAVEAVEETIGE